MRKTIISGIIASVFGLLAPQIIQAQGTTYLSNLDQSSVGSVAVGSDSWLAGIFNTGHKLDGRGLQTGEQPPSAVEQIAAEGNARQGGRRPPGMPVEGVQGHHADADEQWDQRREIANERYPPQARWPRLEQAECNKVRHASNAGPQQPWTPLLARQAKHQAKQHQNWRAEFANGYVPRAPPQVEQLAHFGEPLGRSE